MIATGREKVSAGNPSLLPERRRQIELSLRTRDHDRRNLQIKVANDAASVAPDGDLDTTSLERQLGQPLSSAQIIQRLERCNPDLHFEPSFSDHTKMGIYLIENRPDPVTGKPPWKRFICGFERGFSPEFSVRHFKTERVPDPDFRGNWQEIKTFDSETRGWRTVLARLIRSGLITEPQVVKYFPLGRDSKNWQVLTQ
jgi:hypothetical protein